MYIFYTQGSQNEFLGGGEGLNPGAGSSRTVRVASLKNPPVLCSLCMSCMNILYTAYLPVCISSLTNIKHNTGHPLPSSFYHYTSEGGRGGEIEPCQDLHTPSKEHQFLGLLMFTSLVSLPGVADCWKQTHI